MSAKASDAISALAVALALAAGCSDEPPAPETACIEPMERGNPFTSRPLTRMAHVYRPYDPAEILRGFAGRRDRLRVLEFGMGEGRLLLELRGLFPTAELHGINRCRWAEGDQEEWLLQTGIHFGLFDAEEAEAVDLPTLHFHDANDGDLSFLPSDHFDLIVTQVSLGYVERKDVLIEEFWRILAPDGIALFDVDNLLLMRSGNGLSLEAFAALLREEGFDVELRRNEFPFMTMRKSRREPLDLQLAPKTIDFPIFVDQREKAYK